MVATEPKEFITSPSDEPGNERGKPDLIEIGASGMTSYGNIVQAEYNPDLRGLRGTIVYDKMRRGDGQVRGTLRLVKSPVTSANWYVEPHCKTDPDCVEQAEFIDWAINNIGRSWVRFLWESLLMLDYGYYAFEKVFEYATWTPGVDEETPGRMRPRARTVLKWREFAPRHPLTIQWWLFDDTGHVASVQHQKISGNNSSFESVPIPADKLLLFTLDEEANDPTGISILRSAYKHWYYKDNLYKIDAIQKERHGIGVPVVTLPANYTDEDKKFANEIGRNLRTNEKAHVVLPPGWLLEFAEIRTQPADALRSAEHHDMMIARNVLGQFINLGAAAGSSGGGSRAVGTVQERVFSKSLRYVADLVREQINHDAIMELIRFNYGPDVNVFPEMKVRRLDEGADWRAISIAMARPMPRPAPVTIATLPSTYPAMRFLLRRHPEAAAKRPSKDDSPCHVALRGSLRSRLRVTTENQERTQWLPRK
jgi:hypothetical protein